MNRHQSNPFLAGWEADGDSVTQTMGIFDNDASMQANQENRSDKAETVATTRRHSSSQADISGNPFGAQRSADRRLYHRNMSSFEAASLQLEHQQQLKEYGIAQQSDGDNQTDLIAKMTADFQSAIETNDKQYADANDSSAFDPFETIIDDDVSLPSPALSSNHSRQEDKFTTKSQKKENDNSKLSSEVVQDQDGIKKNDTHDSIDDDEEELVSTPVRNIKSSPDPENTDSIAKASLFASLLATAESGTGGGSQQQSPGANSTNSETDYDGRQQEGNDEKQTTDSGVESTAHIITGSHLSRGGFFDPFETVIDKDALTSLMNNNQQPNQGVSQGIVDDSDNLIAPPTKTPEPTPIHHDGKYKSQEGYGRHLEEDKSTNIAGDSHSIDTVIEKATSDLNERESSSINERVSVQQDNNSRALPRPQKSDTRRDNEQQQLQEAPKSTQTRKANKKKPSFQEDSSDSSEDDERIQIVIKARDTSKTEIRSGPTIVPLLPPPPSKNSMKQARERGQVDDMPSPVMSYKIRHNRKAGSQSDDSFDSADKVTGSDRNRERDIDTGSKVSVPSSKERKRKGEDNDDDEHLGQSVIPMTQSEDEGDEFGKPDTPLYDEDTSYVLDEFPATYEGSGWDMMLRYPPKKKLTGTRFWKKIFVKLAQVPLAPETKTNKQQHNSNEGPQTCIALQIYSNPDDKKPMQEIPIQATYTVSEISSQQFDQFGKIFTIKLQYIFYKERVGVRQGQLARFIHSGHIGTSTTSGGHGVDPISIGAIKRAGAPIEHSPQISQIIKLGCTSYSDIREFKNCLEDYLFRMPIHRDRALSTYKTEEVQMAVRDETYLELNQVGTTIKQLARVRLFFLSFLNGTPTVEVGINDIHRQGREIVGRMDILPVVTEEWIRLEAWELHCTVDKEDFENPDSRIIKLVPPDATFFELLRFRVRPPRNRELPLQISADMSVTRTKVNINCEVMVPGCVSRKHGQIPCENIAIRVYIPECWIYMFREEKHFRMGSKKSVNRRPGKVKGIERFLGGGGLQDINDESSLIEVTSGQAKYEHHHHAIVWRANRWPKESQSAYVQNTMKIRLPLTAYDKMPDSFYEFVHVEYTMPATTVSHTTLRSISMNPCDDEPPEKYVTYSARYEYKVKMRLSLNLGAKGGELQAEPSPIVLMKQPDLQDDLQREEDSDENSDAELGASDQEES